MATPKAETTANEEQKEPWELLGPLPPVSDAEMRWVARHFVEIMQQYGGQWIAVQDKRVIDHSPDEGELGSRLRENNIKAPFIMYIGTEEDTNSGLAL